MEVCCSPASGIVSEVDKQHGACTGVRISEFNGHDLSTSEGAAKALRAAAQTQAQPLHMWFSVPCGAWCDWQRLNAKSGQQRLTLAKKRNKPRPVLLSVSVHPSIPLT